MREKSQPAPAGPLAQCRSRERGKIADDKFELY